MKFNMVNQHPNLGVFTGSKNNNMTEKYKDKYRIKSTRLNGWDYSFFGAYFITICTKNREHYFGEIDNGKMILSTIGVVGCYY